MTALLLGRLNEDQAKNMVESRVNPNVLTSERFAMEESAIRHLAFYYGKQWGAWRGSTIIEPEEKPHRVYYKANYIVGANNRAVSKVVGLEGRGTVIPARDDRRGLESAKLSEKVLEHHLLPVVRYQQKKRKAYLWASNVGSCFLKTTWNPQAGEWHRWYMEEDKTAATRVFTEEEARAKEDAGLYTDLPLGEVALDIVNIFQAFPDQDAKDDIDDCDWFIQQTFMSREKIVRNFGKKYRDVKSGADEWHSYAYQQAIASMQSTSRAAMISRGRGIQGEAEDIVCVREYWERPSLSNGRRGRYIKIIGDTVADNTENPYRWSKERSLHIPFVKLDWWQMPGRFWGIGLTQQLISPQFQLNKARSVMIELQNTHGYPMMFVDKNSGLDLNNFESRPGAIHGINAMARIPQIGPVPTLPKEVAQNYELCRNDLQAIAADSSPDMSKLPGQVRSGQGLRYMLEEKSQVLIPTQRMAFEADEAVARNLLSLAQRYYTGDRVLRYIGEDGDYEVLNFTRADLNNDLRVTAKPDVTYSGAVAKAEIMDMIQIGALDPINNPTDKALALRALDFETTDDLIKRKRRGETRQENEIERMIRDAVRYIGEGGYPAQEWEPHEDHLRILEDFFQTDEFEKLDPKVRALLHMHWRTHFEFKVAKQQLVAQLSAPTQSASKPAGKASQPKNPQ